MALAIEKIEALAPDQASLAAAVKIKPTAWSVLAFNDAGNFFWGECQGSGSTPYRVCLEIADLGAKCSCPSRKFLQAFAQPYAAAGEVAAKLSGQQRDP